VIVEGVGLGVVGVAALLGLVSLALGLRSAVGLRIEAGRLVGAESAFLVSVLVGVLVGLVDAAGLAVQSRSLTSAGCCAARLGLVAELTGFLVVGRRAGRSAEARVEAAVVQSSVVEASVVKASGIKTAVVETCTGTVEAAATVHSAHSVEATVVAETGVLTVEALKLVQQTVLASDLVLGRRRQQSLPRFLEQCWR